jgi:hypothetical protein
MNSDADMGTGEEKVKAMLVEVLRRLNAIDKLLAIPALQGSAHGSGRHY